MRNHFVTDARRYSLATPDGRCSGSAAAPSARACAISRFYSGMQAAEFAPAAMASPFLWCK